MNGNTSIYNTQARGTLIEKRIESLRWDETPPGTPKIFLPNNNPEGLKYKEEKVPSQNVSFITRPDPKEIYEPIDEREEDDFEFFQLSQQTQRMDLNKMDVEQSKSLNTKSQDVSQVSSNATPSTDTSQKNEEKVKLSFKDIVSNLGKSQIPDDQKRQNLQEICAAQQGTQLHKAKGKKYPHKAQAKPRQTQLCSFQADQIVNKKRGVRNSFQFLILVCSFEN